jgi:hypothetical protein
MTFDAMETDADRRFLAFHRDNPSVYATLVELARNGARRGRKRIGMKMIWEVMRWQRFLETTDPDYKLNNNYHSRYARLIMQQEQDLSGIFETRELRS